MCVNTPGTELGPACRQPRKQEVQEPTQVDRDEHLHPSAPRESVLQQPAVREHMLPSEGLACTLQLLGDAH